jgi:hypothetical protein
VLVPLVGWALTFVTVAIAWVGFRAATFLRAAQLLSAMVGLNGWRWNVRDESHGRHQYMRMLIGWVLVTVSQPPDDHGMGVGEQLAVRRCLRGPRGGMPAQHGLPSRLHLFPVPGHRE